MHQLPNLLSTFRIAMAPVLLGLAWAAWPVAFLVGLALSLGSDVADGWLARRYRACTPAGARLDSWGDLLTYLVVLPCLLLLWPAVVLGEALTIGVALAAWVLPMAVGFAKFGQLTSYHTWGAKASSVVMGAALFVLLLLDAPGLLRVGTGLLVLTAIDELLITARLEAPRENVPSCLHV